MLLEKGAFGGMEVDAHDMSLSYWVLTGKSSPLSIKFVEGSAPANYGKIETGTLVREAEHGFTSLMTAFMSDATPYLPVILTGRLYDEDKAYQHLARTDEWGVVGDDGAEETAA